LSHCTSPHSIDFTVMEAKKYDDIYNAVIDQNYPEGITKNQNCLVQQGQKVRDSTWSIILL